MDIALSRNWWMLVVRGVVAVLFGIVSLFWPGISLLALVLLFGVYAILDGAGAIVAAVTGHREAGRWWALWLEGIVGIGAGVVTLVWPGITAIALLGVIAAWAIITGVLEVMAAIRLREQIEGEWLLALAGIVSILFGVLIVVVPSAGALAIAWMVGTYAIIFGAVLIALGVQLRGWRGRQLAT